MSERFEGYVIGIKSIIKAVKAKKLGKIIVASNCPQNLINRVLDAGAKELKIEKFDGDQRKLGTSIGKPFPIAMIGHVKKS